MHLTESKVAVGCRTLLTSKATAIAKALSAPLQSCPSVFVPGEDEHKPAEQMATILGFYTLRLLMIVGHDKASIFKVKAMEAVDRAIGQLASLFWQAESTRNFEYHLCVTGDHSTPVDYGDHALEPVPFATDFVGATGVDAVIMKTSLEPFPLPTIKCGEDQTEDLEMMEERSKQAFSGDSVSGFGEVAAARGCLGRFSGSEMIGIVQTCL
ncbi:hypothetical protein PVL29_018820 [Vitis rotundifolia]|uniref:Metalloenzyme domain-containing protein n=1 Tax=Vitis rotundifolia TaxID=103349 RepID=A0AA38Z681_VITRO|nr:hypothetical protein PVL29_018820 [Vitis rotundifolia]